LANVACAAAASLAPSAAAPHLLLARLKLEREGDAEGALAEARLYQKFLPPPGKDAEALLERCQKMLASKSNGAAAQGQAGGEP
jgi:hypothetical protein